MVNHRRPTSLSNSAATQSGRRLSWSGGWEVAGIVTLFFLLGGEVAPAVNEPHYLTRAKHFWDPSFCQGDYFLESRDAHAVFFACLGWITQWVSLPAAAWIGRFVGWTLLATAWYQLSWALVARRGAALLSAALWITLVQHGHMSGEWLMGGIEGKVIAYGLVVWGWADWVQGRWGRTWIWLGLAAAFHVLVGGWAVVITLLAGFMEFPPDARRLAKSLPGLTLGGIVALAGLVPALRLSAHVPQAIVQRAAEIYVFDRLSHHLLIREFERLLVLRHILLIAAFAVLWSTLRQDRAFARLGRAVWGAVWLVGLGTALDALLGNSPWAARLLRFYWFRASDVFLPLGISLAVIILLAREPFKSRYAPSVILGVLVLALSANLLLTFQGLHSQTIPAADRQGGIHDPAELAAWRDVCDWVRTQLPATARCLTPTDHQTFKWYAQRAEVVTWKDVPQDAEAIVQWSQRLARVLRWYESQTLRESSARLESLQADYRFDYLIMRWPPEFPLPPRPILYRNPNYAVLPAH